MKKLNMLFDDLLKVQDEIVKEFTTNASGFTKEEMKQAHYIIDNLAKARSCLYGANYEYDKLKINKEN